LSRSRVGGEVDVGVVPAPRPGSGEATVTLPPDLERFLPPSLWLALTAGTPRRGVLLDALGRLRSILYLLSTYLPSHLVQEKMRRPVPGLVRGKLIRGSVFFSDLRGFTALSERLAVLGQEGAERLTELMNDYFGVRERGMLWFLARSGGILLKFAGDALLVYFPEQDDGRQTRWAVRMGQRMLEAMSDFAAIDTPLGAVSLQTKIGIATGSFMAVSVGSAERMEYIILGETVARALAAEGMAEGGQLIIDEATHSVAQLEPHCCSAKTAGFYAVSRDPSQDLDDFEIKAGSRRARGAIPWSASPHAIATQMDVALGQIKALTPYLPPDLVARIVSGAGQRRVESEFRSTTVLFLNVTGLEPLLTAWGDGGVQRITRLLDEYFQAMQGVIARHGGSISRVDPYTKGSKMLILFGAPVAHEDDPLRAVSAALDMNNKVTALNDRWRHQLARFLPPELNGPLIQQRAGITQGLTFAGQVGSSARREYTVMGDDVNLAARLMAAAQPGQILLSQRVYDAVVDHISATPLPPIRVKGKSRPIPIYEPTGPREDPLARRLQSRGRLMGRESELQQGRTAIWRMRNGKGDILTLQGSAGIGKSHLADELSRYALARGIRVLFSACRSYAADTPYAPWISLLQNLMGIGSADLADTERGSEKLLRTLSDLELPAAEYADPLARMLGLPRSLTPGRDGGPRTIELGLADRHAEPGKKPPLFAQLEQKVAAQRASPEHGQREKGLDVWQLVRERPLGDFPDGQGRRTAPPGQMWHSLQRRVTARQKERLSAAVGGLLDHLSDKAPLLVVFESVQWMDPASRALLGRLGRELHQRPILVMMVQRSDEGTVVPVPCGVEGEKTEQHAGLGRTLTLGPLDREDTATLVSHLLGKETEAGLSQAIYRQSGGNPLFVEEIVHWLQRTGRDALDDLKGELQASGALQELVLSRLDGLPSGQRDAARAASVAGTEFRPGEILALSSLARDDGGLDDHLAGLQGAGLILTIEAGPDAQYAFRQTLVREVVYGSQSFARRRELHSKLAAYLESQQASDAAQQAELLAHHYELAERPLPAARYLLLSGQKARQRYAYPQAADYYRRALAILERLQTEPVEPDPQIAALKAEIHEEMGDTALLTDDLAAAAADYEAAAGSSLPGAAPAQLLIKLALVLPTQGRTSEAEVCARRAWAAQAAGTDLAAAATLAWVLWRSGDAEASDWIDRALRKARTAQGDDPWTAGVATMLSDLAGDWTQARQAYLTLDRPIGAALAACRLGDSHLEGGNLAEALALYAQAAELWEQERDAYGLALGHYCQAGAYVQSGDASAARKALDEALALLETASTASQEDRLAVQEALEAVETKSWSTQRWERYDDAFRISMLFPA
jgi:class 3 adenylate cyclase